MLASVGGMAGARHVEQYLAGMKRVIGIIAESTMALCAVIALGDGC